MSRLLDVVESYHEQGDRQSRDFGDRKPAACNQGRDAGSIRTSVSIRFSGDSVRLGAEETFVFFIGRQTLLACAIVNYIGLPLSR